jgi:hypothetical protein
VRGVGRHSLRLVSDTGASHMVLFHHPAGATDYAELATSTGAIREPTATIARQPLQIGQLPACRRGRELPDSYSILTAFYGQLHLQSSSMEWGVKPHLSNDMEERKK